MTVIKEGQKVKIIASLADDSKKEFDCLVKAINKESLSLEPRSGVFDIVGYLEEGSELKVNIFTPFGVKIFDSVILNEPEESDLTIEHVEDAEIVQRREYVRVEFYTKLVIEKAGVKPIIAQTIDISGGGVKFMADGVFDLDETVDATLYLPDPIPSIKFQAVVIKHSHFSPKQHVLVYTQISERDRDKIIKQCFEIQRTSATT